MHCPYCKGRAELVTGHKVYPHNRKLHHKFFYLCEPCKAYVGCHGTTRKPLGRLANKELRRAKQEAHKYFDRIWKELPFKRSDAYQWLARRMGLGFDECHIGMFDVAQCQQVVRISKIFLNAARK
ncbi:zinc-finger-containing protein [Zooshikella sp. RANM57]|uniref:zinc-finger-containing protein n=1 Tax=Zooshikella sp. RANM57 TaxID=3425863 RepID=UPI003D6F78D6